MSNKLESVPETESTKKSKYHWINSTETSKHRKGTGLEIAESKIAWVIIGVVGLAAILLGWLMLATFSKNPLVTIPSSLYLEQLTGTFLLNDKINCCIKGAKAIEAGVGETFFIAVEERVEQYDRNCNKINQWVLPKQGESSSLKEVITSMTSIPVALCLVRDGKRTNPFSGKLIYATGNQVFVIEVGKKGVPPTLLSVKFDQGTVVTSVTHSEDFLFFADYGNNQIYRYDPREKGRRFIIGLEDESRKFPGLRPTKLPFFDIVYSPKINAILVTNPGCFRIEAFNPDTGFWEKELSWGEGPWENNGFTGCCNPVGLTILSDGSVITSEKGKQPLLKLFWGGRFETMVNNPDKSPPLDGRSMLKTTAMTDDSLIVLAPSGDIMFFDRQRLPSTEQTIESTEQVIDEQTNESDIIP